MVRVKHDKPRGILNARATEGLRRYWPSEDLAPFVEHFWIVRWNLAEPTTAETLPHPSVHMVLGRERSEVVGVMRGRFSTRLEGIGRVLGTKFRPGAFRAFIDRPMASLSDRRWTLRDVFGARGEAFDAEALWSAEATPPLSKRAFESGGVASALEFGVFSGQEVAYAIA